MSILGFGLFMVLIVSDILFSETTAYEPNWASLDKRPRPEWYIETAFESRRRPTQGIQRLSQYWQKQQNKYDDAKFGIFMHWGVFSVPSYAGAWFPELWTGKHITPRVVDFMKNEVIAKYKYTGELRDAVKRVSGLHFGLYYCQYELLNPLFDADRAVNFTTTRYRDVQMIRLKLPKILSRPSLILMGFEMVSVPQVREVVSRYEPEVFWSDGDYGPDTTGPGTTPDYWQSKQLIAWLYTNSTVKDTVVTNDRWGYGTVGKHGDFYNYHDKFNPGHLMPHKWESCTTLDDYAWSFRRNITYGNVKSLNTVLQTMFQAVSCGGNLLLNVGPTAYGKIPAIFEERLREIGDWLGIHGEALYGTKPWIHQNDTITPGIWYTSKLRKAGKLNPRRIFNPQDEKNTIVFASFFSWPTNGRLKVSYS